MKKLASILFFLSLTLIGFAGLSERTEASESNRLSKFTMVPLCQNLSLKDRAEARRLLKKAGYDVAGPAAAKDFGKAVDNHDTDIINAYLKAGLAEEVPLLYLIIDPRRLTGPFGSDFEPSRNLVGKIIGCGGDVNSIDPKTGATPLIAAAKSGQTEVVRTLIKAGADTNVREKLMKNTALHIASTGSFHYKEESYPKVVRLLIEAGADVNAKNKVGYTPLHFASKFGHPEVVRILIKAGANVNEKDDKGEIPLFFASKAGHPEVVRVLIEAGANVNAKNMFGKTPLEVVPASRGEMVKKILRNHGAKKNEEQIIFYSSKSCTKKRKKAKDIIYSLRLAYAQCLVDAPEQACKNVSSVRQIYSKHLTERTLNLDFQLKVKDVSISKIILPNIGCKWTDSKGKTGRGVYWESSTGKFYAY